MRKLATAACLILGLVSCGTLNTSADDKRWAALNGKEVCLVSGYEKMVHANPECPALAGAKGTLTPAKVQGTRLVDGKGLFLNGPEERLPLCGKCVW